MGRILILLFRKAQELKERILMILLLNGLVLAGWSINCLNDVAQGTTAITRIGRKILMKSVLVQGLLATNTGNSARVLIVYDRQPNGALPAATDVLTSNTIMAAQNLDNRDRFLILADIMPYDQVENISNPSANSGFGYKRYIKCNLETIYSGNAGTIADIMSGSHHDDKLQCWNTYWVKLAFREFVLWMNKVYHRRGGP